MNNESVEKIETVLLKELKNSEVKIEQKNNPEIKIVGIDNPTNMDIENIEKDIQEILNI